MSAQIAGSVDALKRVARNYDNNQARLDKFDISFYALRKDGEYAGGALWDRSTGAKEQKVFTVNDGSGDSRHEPCVYLFSRK